MSQHEIQRLLPAHFEIINLALAGNGPKEIAQALTVYGPKGELISSRTPQSVSLIMKSPQFQHELARRRSNQEKLVDSELANIPAQAKARLQEAALRAAEKTIALMDDAVDQKLQLTAATNVLDRVFGDDAKRQSTTVILNAESIQLLQLAMQESTVGRQEVVVDK